MTLKFWSQFDNLWICKIGKRSFFQVYLTKNSIGKDFFSLYNAAFELWKLEIFNSRLFNSKKVHISIKKFVEKKLWIWKFEFGLGGQILICRPMFIFWKDSCLTKDAKCGKDLMCGFKDEPCSLSIASLFLYLTRTEEKCES